MKMIDIENKEVRVIILHEHWVESLISDSYTFLCLLALLGFGVWVDSIVVQCIGAIMAAAFLFAKMPSTKTSTKMTPEEAIDFLKLKFKVKTSIDIKV